MIPNKDRCSCTKILGQNSTNALKCVGVELSESLMVLRNIIFVVALNACAKLARRLTGP